MILGRRQMVPKLAAVVQRLNLIVAADWIKRVDGWRRRQDSLPSRSEAIRRLTEIGLDSEAKGSRKPKEHQ